MHMEMDMDMGPPFQDIPAMLDEMRRADPAQPALAFYRGRALDGRLTRGELLARVEQLASALHTLGVARGDRVAMLTPNRLDVPPLYLAIWRLGAVAVPLHPGAPDEDWQHVLRHSEARGLIAADALLARAARAPRLMTGGFVRGFAELDEVVGYAPPAERDLAGAPAIILYTSGTTGSPKGVSLAQRSLIWNAWSMARNFGLSRTTQLAVLPLYHAHALGFGMMSSLVSGGHLVLVEKLDPFTWADVIRAEAVRFTSVVPSLLPMLLMARITRAAVPTLRALLVSSAPLGRDRAREFEAQTSIPLIQGWGLSEYTNFACCLALDDPPELLHGSEPTSIGSPLAATDVMVADPDGNPLPEKTRGELCVRGPSRMLGYFKDPESTQKTCFGEWLRTGDEGLFHRDGDRRIFYLTGRIKELIIRDGEKHSPLTIERKLLATLPELDGRLIVVGFPHQAHGEEIGAYLEAGALEPALRARLQAAAEAMPVECRPKIILHGADAIPRTHTGKVQRRKLAPAFAAFDDCRGRVQILNCASASAPSDSAPDSCAADRSPR
jgi:acyl-CoA synthetase (AMP-forming)/AMP-acid ligase II